MQVAHCNQHKKKGEPQSTEVIYNPATFPSLMSNFCSFQNRQRCRKSKLSLLLEENTQSEKSHGMEAKLGEVSLLKWGNITKERTRVWSFMVCGRDFNPSVVLWWCYIASFLFFFFYKHVIDLQLLCQFTVTHKALEQILKIMNAMDINRTWDKMQSKFTKGRS